MSSVDARISRLLASDPDRTFTVEYLRRVVFDGEWGRVDDAIRRAIICEVITVVGHDDQGEPTLVRLNRGHPDIEVSGSEAA